MAMNLSQQLEEVQYELDMRRAVYPRLIRRGTLRQSEADYHIKRMEAVKNTLTWLMEHESEVKSALRPQLGSGVVGEPTTGPTEEQGHENGQHAA